MRQTNSHSEDFYFMVQYPEALCFADSAKCPVNLALQDIDHYPNYNQDVLLTIHDVDTGEGFSEARVTDANGMAYFDIARYVQVILGDVDADGVYDYSQQCAVVTQKNIRITLTYSGTDFFTATFFAVHGNNKITDRWWSKPRKLRWWTNYPFAFDIVASSATITAAGGSVTTWTPSGLPGTLPLYQRIRAKASTMANGSFTADNVKGGLVFDIASASDTGHVAGTKLFDQGDNKIAVIADACPADPNAAYLRWLDRHCELRHWLFRKYRETDTVQAAEDVRSGYDPDRITDGVLQDGRLWQGTKTKELTVNTGYLQGWEYDLAASIVNAPFVDMLDMDAYLEDGTIIWHRLTVKAGSYAKPLRNRHANDHDLQLAVTLQYDGERSVGV